jgi:hypothetical protein
MVPFAGVTVDGGSVGRDFEAFLQHVDDNNLRWARPRDAAGAKAKVGIPARVGLAHSGRSCSGREDEAAGGYAGTGCDEDVLDILDLVV